MKPTSVEGKWVRYDLECNSAGYAKVQYCKYENRGHCGTFFRHFPDLKPEAFVANHKNFTRKSCKQRE
jgi:hypothetical protein